MPPRPLVPLHWPAAFWIAFMAAASAALSLGFACAAPLAAAGAVSALTLSRRGAVIAILAAWAANQAIGFAVLDYPVTANSLAWGAVIGTAAMLAMFAAYWSGGRIYSLSRAAVPLAAFAAAFTAYEAALFVAARTFLGGAGDFTAAIVSRVFEINAIAMIGMLLLNHAATAIGSFREAERSRSLRPAPQAKGLKAC